MNVSLQNIDKVSALLTVKLEKADYQEKVDKSLKGFRQKAEIPGFRKGMVPMSLVKKMYGKSVIAEEVNKLLSNSIFKYIEDNKVNMLGEPLPNEEINETMISTEEFDNYFKLDENFLNYDEIFWESEDEPMTAEDEAKATESAQIVEETT